MWSKIQPQIWKIFLNNNQPTAKFFHNIWIVNIRLGAGSSIKGVGILKFFWRRLKFHCNFLRDRSKKLPKLRGGWNIGKSAHVFYGWILKTLFFYQMTRTEKFRAGAYTGIQSSLSKHWKDKNKSCQLSKGNSISESFSLLHKSQNKIATLRQWAFSL